MPQEMTLTVAPDGSLRVRQAPGAVRASGTPSGYAPIYGAGGMFGICGVEPTLINACVGPTGYESQLLWRGTDIETPLYDALTYIGTTGYGQTGLCYDCGKPELKECVQTACLSRICQQTNEHSFDQLGMRMNRGVPRVALFGNITAPDGTILIPQGQEITDRFTLELMAVAYNLRRGMGRVLWSGNPANNNGGYMEHPGFQLLVNTGKFDIMTQTACSGLDSYISNYGNAVVGVAGAPNIVSRISGMVRSAKYRMQTAGFDEDTAEMDIVMHPRHWDIISNVWFCDYGIICSNAQITNESMILDIANRRDELLRSRMLPIDGKMYPVILDNLMPNTPAPYGSTTRFCGDIYGITRTIEGEVITWGEYQDFNLTAAQAISYFQSQYGSVPITITDGGRFMHAPTVAGGFCFDVRVLAKRRVIMKMPQYSWRLTNVCTVPIGDYADVTGSGGLYERDGGIYSKPYMGLYGNCGAGAQAGTVVW